MLQLLSLVAPLETEGQPSGYLYDNSTIEKKQPLSSNECSSYKNLLNLII